MEHVLAGHVLVREGGECPSHQWRSGRIAVEDQERHPVQEQIGRALRALRGCGPDRPSHCRQIGRAGEAAGVHGGDVGVPVGLTGQPRIERLELGGRSEQQRRGVHGTVHGERDLRAQQVHPGVLERVHLPGFSDGQQVQGCIGRPREVGGVGRGQRAPRPAGRIGGQLGGTPKERGRCGQPAACLRPPGRVLQLSGDLLVRPCRRLRCVPGPSIGVHLGVRRVCQRTVHGAPLVHGGRVVDGRAQQRVAEPHPRADLQQPGLDRRRRLRNPGPESLGGPPEQHRVAHGLGRGDQQQLSGGRR